MKVSFQTVMFVVAAGFLAVSALTWFAFLRPVPTLRATAVVKAVTHKPAGSYLQQQVGVARGFRTPVEISTAECLVLELDSDELGIGGFFSVDPSESEQYPVGGQVVMEYQQRGLPIIGYRTMVTAIRPR